MWRTASVPLSGQLAQCQPSGLVPRGGRLRGCGRSWVPAARRGRRTRSPVHPAEDEAGGSSTTPATSSSSPTDPASPRLPDHLDRVPPHRRHRAARERTAEPCRRHLDRRPYRWTGTALHSTFPAGEHFSVHRFQDADPGEPLRRRPPAELLTLEHGVRRQPCPVDPPVGVEPPRPGDRVRALPGDRPGGAPPRVDLLRRPAPLRRQSGVREGQGRGRRAGPGRYARLVVQHGTLRFAPNCRARVRDRPPPGCRSGRGLLAGLGGRHCLRLWLGPVPGRCPMGQPRGAVSDGPADSSARCWYVLDERSRPDNHRSARGSSLRRSASAALSAAVSVTLLSGVWAPRRPRRSPRGRRPPPTPGQWSSTPPGPSTATGS